MITIEDLYGFALPEQPAISPDGTEIVYVLRTTDRTADRDVRALWRVANGAATQLTRGKSDRSPAWAPDGSRIAFLRDQGGPAQVWLLPADGGEPEQVTSLPLGAGAPVWNADGTRLAFTAPVGGADGPVVTARLGYKADGSGLLRDVRAHLHVLDLDSREVRQVTSGDWHAGAPAWSPDGTRLAFTAGRDEDADLTFRRPVHVVDAGGQAEPEVVGLVSGAADSVTWTAGGLLVTGRTTADVGHTSLLHLSLDGEVRDLSAPLDRNVMPGMAGYPGGLPSLIEDGRVLFCARDRGCTQLYAVDLEGGEPELLVGGDSRVVSGLSASNGVAAIVLSTSASYGEISTVDLATGELTICTEHGTSAERFVPEEREFTISDGTTVHGWLVRDPSRTGPSPLLLDIHGGPHNAWNGTADPVHLYHQVLAQDGWTVLLLNPRGSDGYGEAFYQATIGAWGKADAPDFLEPIDQLVSEQIADPAQLAVTGYSYGGYMTCYLTSRDTRFAAAVAGGVVSDLTSFAGTSDVGHGFAEFELAGAQDIAELSPLTRSDEVRTPTLIYHGTADDRCPVGQAEQWFTALRQNGTPVELVLYPGSSHLFILNGTPSHRADFNRRVVDWVREHTTGRVPLDAKHWQQRLSALAEKHGVPGAALGILKDGEIVQAHHGVLNTATGVEVTDDSVFHIGSMTKVMTTTVVMQLVDEGLLDLDAPVADVLPELKLADPDVAKKVTMRHLLTHTSGIGGDNFADTGRGDDCLERYVDQLAGTGQTHPLGATLSYCNSGFVLAGRVVEKLTGKTWDTAMRERLFAPLGLTQTGTLPEEALLHRAAVGHLEQDGGQVPAPVWQLPRSMGPAGTIFSSTADVLAFARLHLDGGLAPDGTRVLSETSAAAMTEKQAEVPDPNGVGDSWGLGWFRCGWGGRRLIGHDGNTTGQSAFLRLSPEHGLAVTLLTNGPKAREVYLELYREIFAELAGVEMPPPLEPAASPPAIDVTRYVGRYEREGVRIDITEGENGLRFKATITGPLAAVLPEPPEFVLVPIDDSLFVARASEDETWTSVFFYSLPTGEQYLHAGIRATPKVS